MRPHRLALGTLALTLGVIAWGGFVRASGSGAGCGAHWPLCNGQVVPRPEAIETVIELTHRVTSGLALIAVAALAVVVFRASRRGDPARAAALASVFFMLTEAAVGAGLVLLEYVAADASPARAWWMAGHLVNTFFHLAALAATVWWTGPGAGTVRAVVPASARALAAACAALVLLVGASGGVAALGDTLYPAATLAEGMRQDFSPGTALLVRLRVFHPVLALVASLTLVLSVPYLARLGKRRARFAGRVVTVLVVAQLLAGSVNLVLLAPIGLQIVHLVLADLLWLGLVFFLLAVFTRGPGTPVAPTSGGRPASVALGRR
jgi:heme A synthase